MQLLQHISLRPYNTFGIDAKAEYFTRVHTLTELRTALQKGIRPVTVLGGGSNLLFTRDVEGLVLRNEIKGIRVRRYFPHVVHVEAGGGETWHDLVSWSLERGYGGLENLSLIPGSVGAAPIQNIGAYGVELKDVFFRLRAVEIETGRERTFYKKDCHFGYRDSIFKQELKGRYVITQVVLRLTRDRHAIHTDYGAIREVLAEAGIRNPEPADIGHAVVHIRRSKLPDPAVLSNAGSFFKNPSVSPEQAVTLAQEYPAMPRFEQPDGTVKIPAGWLIEQCGWKGKRMGRAGAYEKQALVLVNYGGATGAEIRQLAAAIILSVETRFGIRLSPEVNIL